MPTTAVRPGTGATSKPGPMVTVVPEREVTEDRYADFTVDSGLNGPFLADQLSAFVAHERMGINLLRTLHARTDNPALRARFADLEAETLNAVGAWETLIGQLGGSHQYASPAGRATESFDSKAIEALLLSGSTDPLTFEQAGLQTYLCAASQCVTNVHLLEELAREADDGEARAAMNDAVAALAPGAREHVDWATQTLTRTTITQAKHPIVQKVARAAERATDKVRTAFGGSPD
jgi:hypothetical protein